MSTRTGRWTNKSVVALAGSEDPVAALTHRARQVVMKALDEGWSGPPFDPIALAELLKIPVIPRDDVPDARTVPVGKDGVRIEFNPSRPPNRVRYSIAHEIAHTLFPDCAAHVRNRATYHEVTGDDWQLEALCNIGAAELLMPAGSMPILSLEGLTIERLMELRLKYAVSAEALLIRVARTAETPCAMFCASRIDQGSRAGRYRLDYMISSPAWSVPVPRGTVLPERSALHECVAIGYTARGQEEWGAGAIIHAECVAIPSYPGQLYPRVVGFVVPVDARASREAPLLGCVRGDATEPRGQGARIIAHVVNDATANWGGRGFASAVGHKWPAVHADFHAWVAQDRGSLSLGRSHYTALDAERGIFHMVAQHGYGPSAKPRIRYAALETCLEALGALAVERSASVHMPRIGTGQAGGSWDVIRDMILASVCARGIRVTVYDLPNSTPSWSKQGTLFGS
jgi:O-acetyl-ADP-ribose deacetylase (regulator of RNase III)